MIKNNKVIFLKISFIENYPNNTKRKILKKLAKKVLNTELRKIGQDYSDIIIDKNGKKNYIGGATFIEIYEAFMKGKKIYLYNDIPEGMLYDEISGFSPIVIKGDINLVK